MSGEWLRSGSGGADGCGPDGTPGRDGGHGSGSAPGFDGAPGHVGAHGYDDAAYVLGALDPAERQRFERHLSGCAACSDAVQRLAGVAGLLAHTGHDGLAAVQGRGPDEPPSGLLPGLVARVELLRHRRRRRVVLLAAAAVLAVGAGIGTAVALDGPDSVPPVAGSVRTVELSAVSGAPLVAEVALTSRPWGTGVQVTCRYTDSGGDPSVPYDLVVIGTDGRTEQAGSWLGLAGAEATVDGATTLTTEDIAAVEVRLADGRTVLRGSP